MTILLDYYSTYGPSGKINARCVGDLHHCKIYYHLHNEGGLLQTQTANDNELIAFLYSSPAKYRIVAEVHPE